MKLIRSFMVTILLLFLALSCKEGGNNEPLTLPSNLTVDVDISTDGSGDVTVTASAQNANFYTIYFGEVQNEIPVKSTNGIAQYSYSQSGEYTIRVQANATASQYIEQETAVTIVLANPDDVIIPTTGYVSPTNYEGLTLAWQDDFSGTTLNASNWSYEIGRGSNGWGNNELQYYREENTKIQDGHLIITAKKENFADASYTSSRLITKEKKSFQYGRVDIRAVLPKGQGIWPAFWMLGNNFPSVGWPACGEIDIMEMIGGNGRENNVFGTLHWSNAGAHACTCGQGDGFTLNAGTFNDEFHVFSIVWNANTITWLVDNQQFHQIDITPAEMSEFRAPFYFIFNLAVGGNLPGSPNDNTQFPQHMIIDYVRVFQ
jgi:beta-glucanase (GH16 family)